MKTVFLNKGDIAVLNQIVDRCNVGESNLFVIRYAISKLANKYRTFAALGRNVRRELMRAVIYRHATNGELYNYVMKGKGRR